MVRVKTDKLDNYSKQGPNVESGVNPEQLKKQICKEQQSIQTQKESDLEDSLAPFKVGTFPFLNCAPLIRGIEDQLIFDTPSRLAQKLKSGELDAALVSIVEVLFNDMYDVIDGISISSLGEVKSVLLLHRTPLEEIKLIHCDPASLTSIFLLKILLFEKGIHPEFCQLESYELANFPDNVLLIGDHDLDMHFKKHDYQIWDLGAAWYELTRLPFVYAVWALRRDKPNQKIRMLLKEAKDFGIDTLDSIISRRKEYSYNFRKDYLSWHIHYHLADDEKRGINKFIDYLKKYNFGTVYEPRFVN